MIFYKQEMQECFEKQDIGGLQAAATKIDAAEFQVHLKRCIDSGLWIPDAQKDAEEKAAAAAAAADAGDRTDASASSGDKTNSGSEETEMRRRKPAPASDA